MVYRVIGVVSGSSLNGLDVAYAELHETTGKWTAEILAGERIPYDLAWKTRLKNSGSLPALEYETLNIDYGKYIAEVINGFIEKNQLHYKVQLIACQGHTTFYKTDRKICSQLADGATIAALTGINVVCDARSIDLALGGKGAPVFPVAEKLLFPDQHLFLHIGSNANLSRHFPSEYQSFDVCPANLLLDALASRDDKEFDPGGAMAAEGDLDTQLLGILNDLEYYHLPLPKTLSRDFTTDVVNPLFDNLRLNTRDALRTACEHIAMQIVTGVDLLKGDKLFVTGGGGNNTFLIERITELLKDISVEVVIPDPTVVNFKESLAMALIGVLRWREENNVFAYITGAARDSIGGTVWIGQEA